MKSPIGHGFLAPVITNDNFLLGAANALPFEVIQDNGNWSDFLPEAEWQARREWDTFGCTVYNSIKPIATLFKKLFGKDRNDSERFTYNLAGVNPPGSNPHIIGETIRKTGLVAEELLPFDDSITNLEAYKQPIPMSGFLLSEGQRFLTQYDFRHEWVFNGEGEDVKNKHEKLKEALRRSPLGVSVCAWKEQNGLYYKDEGDVDQHWTFLYSYDAAGYPMILDSYEPYIKRLDKNYDFGFAKRYYLTRKIEIIPVPKRPFFSFAFIQKWFPPQPKFLPA